MPRPAINDYTFYKIVNVNADCEMMYVGSTCNMKQRRKKHKGDCNNPNAQGYNFKVYKTIREHGGWDEFNMIEIGTAEQITLTEAHVIEETYRIELKANMNTRRCYGIESAEYHKQYYIDNSDKIKEQQKQWHVNNADKINERKKEYYVNNVDKIKERQKEYRVNNAEKLKERHNKYYVNNADKINERTKQYYIDNSDKLKEYDKQYRVNNADKIKEKHNCECGGKYTTCNKSQHIKTAMHQNHLQHI